jgi:hypothetical protein
MMEEGGGGGVWQMAGTRLSGAIGHLLVTRIRAAGFPLTYD